MLSLTCHLHAALEHALDGIQMRYPACLDRHLREHVGAQQRVERLRQRCGVNSLCCISSAPPAATRWRALWVW